MAHFTDLLKAAKDNNIIKVEQLLAVLPPEHIECSGALREAAIRGHTKCVQLLCNGTHVSDKVALFWACQNGHLECVQILIDHVDPKIEDSYPLYCAARAGRINVVDFLIPLSDPRTAHSRALSVAAKAGHTHCVAALISVSNPKDNNSQALREALLGGHTNCIEMLYPVSDTNAILKDLEHILATQPYHATFDQAYTILKAMMEKEQLEQNIAIPNSTPSLQRKI